MEASDYCIISTTTDSKENADAITQLLLEKKLVACVQSTTIQSAYHWQGKIIKSEEILLQMKTRKSLFEKIQTESFSYLIKLSKFTTFIFPYP